MRNAICVTVAAVLVAGCGSMGSRYTPRKSPRIVAMRDGLMRVYVRDGRAYASNNLLAAVKGVPEAERVARSARRQQKIFVWTAAPAAVCLGGIFIYEAARRGEDPEYELPAALAVPAIACGVALIIGEVVYIGSIGREEDAINIYNDAIDEQLGRDTRPWALSVRLAPPPTEGLALYTLVEDRIDAATEPELRARLEALGKQRYREILIGGENVGDAVRFENVVPGRAYTLCVMTAPSAEPPVDWSGRQVTCQPVAVPPSAGRGEVVLGITVVHDPE